MGDDRDGDDRNRKDRKRDRERDRERGDRPRRDDRVRDRAPRGDRDRGDRDRERGDRERDRERERAKREREQEGSKLPSSTKGTSTGWDKAAQTTVLMSNRPRGIVVPDGGNLRDPNAILLGDGGRETPPSEPAFSPAPVLSPDGTGDEVFSPKNLPRPRGGPAGVDPAEGLRLAAGIADNVVPPPISGTTTSGELANGGFPAASSSKVREGLIGRVHRPDKSSSTPQRTPQVAPCYMMKPNYEGDALVERQLIFPELPQSINANSLMTFLNTFILGITRQTQNAAQASLGPGTRDFKPVYDCDIVYDGKNAVATFSFRSFEGTQCGLMVNQAHLEFEGTTLKAHRPPEFFECERYKLKLAEVNTGRRLEWEAAAAANAATAKAAEKEEDAEMPDANGFGGTQELVAPGEQGGEQPEELSFVPLTTLPDETFNLSHESVQQLSLYELFGIPNPARSHAVDPMEARRRAGNKLSFLEAPQHLPEYQLKELFRQFGTLKFFQLLNRADGSSKGYGMMEFEDDENFDYMECANKHVI